MIRVALGLALAGPGALAGCGSSGGGRSDGRPDTGYGADQPVPATETCADYCQRTIDCTVHLCDEDTNSTTYLEFESIQVTDCETLCSDAEIQAAVPSAAWQCLFAKSCRQVLGVDGCGVGASYSCGG
ncbi:MAG TPA: hypothetical protein VHO06_24280 [Polyangia bacterium]|nr:hypothetical protein [Polyangia bacterium]